MFYKNFDIELADGTQLSLMVDFDLLDMFMRERTAAIDKLPAFKLHQLMTSNDAIRPVHDFLRQITLDLYSNDVIPPQTEHTTAFTFALALVSLWKNDRIMPGEEVPLRLH